MEQDTDAGTEGATEVGVGEKGGVREHQERVRNAHIDAILAVQTEDHRQRLRTFIAALPSYRQGVGYLVKYEDRQPTYCCLGVATEEAISAGEPVERELRDDYAHPHAIFHDRGRHEASGTGLLNRVASFYGLHAGAVAHSGNPLLLVPPTVPLPAGGADNVFGRVTTAQYANDTLKFTFEQIAECFQYTYLRGDWNTAHPELAGDVA